MQVKIVDLYQTLNDAVHARDLEVEANEPEATILIAGVLPLTLRLPGRVVTAQARQ